VKRHLHPHIPNRINKEANTSFGHTLTCSSRSKFRVVVREEERERGAFLGDKFLYLVELSLGIVLSIYNKKVFVGFSPPRWFPRINDVSCDCVFLNHPIYAIVI
jgi:hypothetical protein